DSSGSRASHDQTGLERSSGLRVPARGERQRRYRSRVTSGGAVTSRSVAPNAPRRALASDVSFVSSFLDAPARAERGRGGGFALDRAYTLPPVNLTAREAALLVKLGEFATQTRLLPFADTLALALDKVRGALSASAQRELIELMDAIQFVGVPAHTAPPAVRHAVEQAWFERQPLLIRYQSPDYGVTT